MKKILAIAVLALPIVGCGSGSSSTTAAPIEGGILNHSAKQIALNLDQNFNQLKANINELNQPLMACDNSLSQADLESAQTRWETAMVGWQSLQFMTQDPLYSSGIHIQIWPNEKYITSAAGIEGVLNGTFDITQSWLETSGNQGYRGLQGLEYLLFKADEGKASILESYQANERRCQLTKVVATHLNEWANEVTGVQTEVGSGWFGQPGLREYFYNPTSSDSAYASVLDLHEEWLTDFVSGLESIKNDKLQAPLGWDEGACMSSNYAVNTDRLEARYAKQSLAIVFAQAKALKLAYENYYRPMLVGDIILTSSNDATANPAPEPALSTALAAEIDGLFSEVLGLETSLQSLVLNDFISDELSSLNIDNGQPDVQLVNAGKPVQAASYVDLLKLHQGLRSLTSNFKVEVAALLDVTISFNATDGDSGRPSSTNCWPE